MNGSASEMAETHGLDRLVVVPGDRVAADGTAVDPPLQFSVRPFGRISAEPPIAAAERGVDWLTDQPELCWDADLPGNRRPAYTTAA
jgi:hypothetical protein